MNRSSVQVRLRAAGVGLSCCFAAASSAFAGDGPIEVTWVGGGGADSSWGNPLNWNPPVVPQNTADTTYRVIFNTTNNTTVVVGTPRTVTDMIVGPDARMFFQDSSISVLDRAEFAGLVNSNGTLINAVGPGAAFVGPRASLITNASLGQINFGGSTLDTSGNGQGHTLLEARNGCRIDLPNLTSINANFLPLPNALTTSHRIRALINGTISMPALQTIRGAQRPIDALDIFIDAGTAFHAPNLREISDGYSNIRIVGDVSLPSLERLSFSRLRIENSTAHLPVLTNFDNCEVSVRAGQIFQTLPTTMTTTGLTAVNGSANSARYDILDSRGGGTMLDARSIQVIDAGFVDTGPNYTTTHVVSALSGGQLDLSNLHTAIGPNDGTDSLTFTLASPSFPAPVLAGLTQTYGHVKFNVQRNYALPSLVHAEGSNFIVTSGGRLAMPNLQTHDFARFDYEDGATFASRAESWPLRDFGRDVIITRAVGPGTVLDFSSVRTIDDSAHTEFGFSKFHVGNQAVLDFSGLQTIVPPSGLNSTLVFEAASEMRFGRLLLPSKVELRAIGGPIRIGGDLIITPGGGYTGNDAFVASTFVAGSIDIMTSDPIRGFFRKSDLHMVGSEVATLEVASQDIGIRQNPLHEFVFGTLTLGSDAGPAYVRLVDLHNNAPLLSPEALYLRGAVDGTANTLSLLNGSTLEIGNFSVYARLNGAWTDLHSLFPPGVDLIAYQDGFLFIPSPGSWIPVGLAALYVSRRRRAAGP